MIYKHHLPAQMEQKQNMPNLHQPESGISWHMGSPGEDILKVRWEYTVFLYHFSVGQTVRAGENLSRRKKNT
jgi:hypothetical protein